VASGGSWYHRRTGGSQSDGKLEHDCPRDCAAKGIGSAFTVRLTKQQVVVALTLLIPLAASCAGMNHPGGGSLAGVTPPTVTFTGVRLADGPSARQLAAYMCPEVGSTKTGTSAALCEQFFGSRPEARVLNIVFDLRFHITNPNRMPLSVGSVLAAVTLFPASADPKQGAACVSLCAPGATGCGETPRGACETSTSGVRSLGDFTKGSIPGFVIAKGIPTPAGEPPSFAAPQIVESGETDITVRYALDPEPLLNVFRRVADQSSSQIATGAVPNASIPYRLEGTIWFDAGSIGRVSVGWGPTEGNGALPADEVVAP